MTQVERNLAVRAKNLELTEEDMSFIKEDLGIYVKEAFNKPVTHTLMSSHTQVICRNRNYCGRSQD